MTNVTPVTATEVRDYFLADPKRQARLSDKAKAALKPGQRGALPRDLVKEHNRRRKTRQYQPGNSARAVESARDFRANLRSQGVEVGVRGPLPKAVQAQRKG